jgi:hypothetical protein
MRPSSVAVYLVVPVRKAARSGTFSEIFSPVMRASSVPLPLVSASTGLPFLRRASAASLVRSADPDMDIATPTRSLFACRGKT